MTRRMRTFYEFFAGAGMARAGLGTDWECLFANDIDARKGASCAANWGGGEHLLRVCDVAVADDRGYSGGQSRSRLGVILLPGHIARWRPRWARRSALQRVLGLLAARAGAALPGTGAKNGRDREYRRPGLIAWRTRLRGDPHCLGRGGLSLRSYHHRRGALRSTIAASFFVHRGWIRASISPLTCSAISRRCHFQPPPLALALRSICDPTADGIDHPETEARLHAPPGSSSCPSSAAAQHDPALTSRRRLASRAATNGTRPRRQDRAAWPHRKDRPAASVLARAEAAKRARRSASSAASTTAPVRRRTVARRRRRRSATTRSPIPAGVQSACFPRTQSDY